MMATEDAVSRWVVVSSEAELLQAVPMWPVPLVAGLPGDDCLEGVTSLVRRRHPVAVLVAAGQLLGIRVPEVGEVASLWPEGDQLFFTISGSPSLFTLPRNSDFGDLVEAEWGAGPLLVLDPAYDGRPVLVQRWAALPAAPACDDFELDFGSLTPVSAEGAHNLYHQVFALDSRRPYVDGIPFRLAERYCEAKAEAICEHLLARGITSGKVWIKAQRGDALRVNTSSRRSCVQVWSHHVAVVLRADVGRRRSWILDPTVSLEAGALSYRAWRQRFSATAPVVRLTSASAYRLRRDCFDTVWPGQNDGALQIARCLLRQFACEEGHPPFRCSSR